MDRHRKQSGQHNHAFDPPLYEALRRRQGSNQPENRRAGLVRLNCFRSSLPPTEMLMFLLHRIFFLRPASTTGALVASLAGLVLSLAGLLAPGAASNTASADWPQWRGPDRTGFTASGPLVEKLPSQGLAPLWNFDGLPGGNSGGWSSPVIVGDRVFVYSHTKSKNPSAKQLGPAKYPWLAPEKRTGMTDAEYEEYEVKRRDESEQRSKAYRYDERMVCLNLDSGDVIWDRSDPSHYTRFTQSGTPCVAGKKVLVLGAARTARCYDLDSGEVVWTRRLPGEFRDEYYSSSFAVTGKVALVCCGPLVALDLEDGTILWQGDEPEDFGSHSSPIVWNAAEPVAIVNGAGGSTKGYRISDGKKIWEIESGAGRSTPIVAQNILLTYGSSRKSGLTAFDLDPDAPEKEPSLRWQFQRAADSGSTPVVRGESVFVQGDKRIAKVNLTDGSTVWQTTMRISNPRYTSLVAAGDQVFYSWEGMLTFDAESETFQTIYDAEIDSDGVLITAEDLRVKLKLDEVAASQGLAASEKIWQQKAIKTGPLGCSSPAFSDGRIVVRLRNAVVCYDLRR